MRIYRLLVLLLGSHLLIAQNKPFNLEEIEQAIQLSGQYAADVLINEVGSSRCDYELISGQWQEYEPAWHTGQVIYGLLEAFRITGDSSFLNTSIKAGDWWASQAITEGPLAGFFAGLHGGDVASHLINFTTLADGSPGLFLLSRLTGNPEYAHVATSAGHWAMHHLYLPEEGVLYDIVDFKTGEIWKTRSPHYPGDSLPLHLVTRPNNEGFLFKDMYLHTGKSAYRDVFLNLSNSLLAKQHENGLWLDYHPNHEPSGKLHPRFNIWYAESLIEAYSLTQDSRYLEAAARTMRTVQKWQQKQGHIYYTNRMDESYDAASICGSATAYAGLIWLRLWEAGYDEFQPNAIKSLEWVLANQLPSDHPDPNLRGAIWESWRKWSKDGAMRLYVRDIATSFSLRLMATWHDHLNNQSQD
ncbi:MAG TPA: hypothetical protein PKA00_00960 [Saprospiraceae bacterium]|nr:hypothetical protein [Saprospiraceae bacterium]HMQ81436.1 hypothetical protein [Saprospiraceae bacterium]